MQGPVPGSTACPGRFFRGLFARLCGFVSVSIWLIHLRGRVLRNSHYWEAYEKNKGPQKMTKTHRDYPYASKFLSRSGLCFQRIGYYTATPSELDNSRKIRADLAPLVSERALPDHGNASGMRCLLTMTGPP
jgi:hypothetical protein